MPGLTQKNDHLNGGSSAVYSLSANGFWSQHGDDVSYVQLQKFWSELLPQARQKLLRIDKQTLFEQARKNMYCSRCNGLLLEGFLQIVMYGKSLQQGNTCVNHTCNRLGVSKSQTCDGSLAVNGFHDEIQDPSVHPWGGLTTTREGLLTLLGCYLYSKSFLGLQNVFDSARARERERELLYPDACGGGGRGWISQGTVGYGRGHGTRETCALHTARLSCDTLVDFWSALGEETRQSLLRMKEEDFIERLMYRFDSKRFCRDCRRNVIREFKELKELKRMRREPCCTSWFCVADMAFHYEVSDDTIQADWHQTFADSVETYHYFEWAVGSGEGKSDILEFENVGMNGSVKMNGLDLGGLNSCFITLRAWKLDGRCTELSVKAHALKGQQCVHRRLIVGDGFVTITRGENIRRFFEHAEEAEEEEEDDSMDKDANDLDGDCSRPQKHAKSPELAREFLLDAATVIFKEQVEKAFREGTARQNAHSIFVCLALKLLEERVHIACKEIITLEKQMKLLEEEEKEKREEKERKERKRTKEREKKLRRKERLKGKEKDKDKISSESAEVCSHSDILEDLSPCVLEQNSISVDETCDASIPESSDTLDEQFLDESIISEVQSSYDDGLAGKPTDGNDGNESFMVDSSKFSRWRLKFPKEVQDHSFKWSERRRFSVSENGAGASRSEQRYYGDSLENPSRTMNGSNRKLRTNSLKAYGRHISKFNEKSHSSNNRVSYDYRSCVCNQNNELNKKAEAFVSSVRVNRDVKSASTSESSFDMSKQCSHSNRYSYGDHSRDGGRLKNKNNSPGKDYVYSKKVWEPMESQKKYPRSNSDSNVAMKSSTCKFNVEPDFDLVKSGHDACSGEVAVTSSTVDQEESNSTESTSGVESDEVSQNGLEWKDHKNIEEDACEVTKRSVNSTGTTLTSSGTNNRVGTRSLNSDSCSSCPSEGDSSNICLNHGNLESLSTSDSEDASHHSEGKESSASIQNGFSEHHETRMDKVVEVDALGIRNHSGLLQEIEGCKVQVNAPNRVPRDFEAGFSAVSLDSSPCQVTLPPTQNQTQNIHFPVFQVSPAMGYYHQNSVSWPAAAAHANGIIPFSYSNHCLYTNPLGYGLSDNPRFCMQYSHLHHLTTPVFNPSPVPIYQPASKANNGVYTEERSEVPKTGSMVESSDVVANPDVIGTTGLPYAISSPPGRDRKQNDTSILPNDSSSFSLFHFGGPVAFSTGGNLKPMPSKEDDIVGDFSRNNEATDVVDNVHAFNKKETAIEEYNLFAASNGMRFSFF
ncbi:uncharacterized protein LOC111432432 [Cucurbita moschata]|uniref:Uncharacterized protein LOC111432432 n=1 Tax=Cucurbita moschata TaxID=3662 RepID=A0A6J1EE83_CUCMO|nr:uncharacterized protein LOC111432432 [Cucurbita moschata]